MTQVDKAKVYQSTAAAAAMENAVEQTSKFVFHNFVLHSLLTCYVQCLLFRTSGRSLCVLRVEILFLKIGSWSCLLSLYAFIPFLVVLRSHLLVVGQV